MSEFTADSLVDLSKLRLDEDTLHKIMCVATEPEHLSRGECCDWGAHYVPDNDPEKPGTLMVDLTIHVILGPEDLEGRLWATKDLTIL